MSVRCMTWAFDQLLSPFPKLVLVCLGDHADDEGWCWPSIQRIADKCGMNERTVRRHIHELSELELVDIFPRFGDSGVQSSNGYQLTIPPSERPKAPRRTERQGRGAQSPPSGELNAREYVRKYGVGGRGGEGAPDSADPPLTEEESPREPIKGSMS